MDVIAELILRLVFSYPGAGIRWLISKLGKSKKTYQEILDEDADINGVVGFFTLAIPILILIII